MEYTPWSRVFRKKDIAVLIGELAKRSGYSRDTLRYYEKLGLIEGAISGNSSNTYKHYEEDILDRLWLITKAKMLGFTLMEIKDLIDDWEDERLSMEEKRAIFLDKMNVIDDKIEELQRVKAYLQTKLELLMESNLPTKRPKAV
jgi:DNA-binding transcriptional MerR regulator